jgi:hypothetical protein
MTVKFTVLHRADPNNVGDIASNPLQYFLKQDEYHVVDIAHLDRSSYDATLPMIVGGGGLIGNTFFGDFYHEIFDSPDVQQLERMHADSWQLSNLSNKKIYDDFNLKYNELIEKTISKIPRTVGPRFLWGAGHNSADAIEFNKIKWPKEFSRFTKIGIRDYDPISKFSWTPCASCMHPALDKKYAIKNDVIWFEHKKQLIKDFGSDPIPRFINSGSNIEQTIELLGSANVILTNSYHGAYWGTLLKKKVIIVGAWSSKFNWLRHPPLILDKKEHWKDCVDEVEIHHTALEECRTRTLDFWQEIKDFR